MRSPFLQSPFVSVFGGPGRSSGIYLDTVNGDDAGDGSASAPFATAGKVNATVAGLNSGVTLNIMAGSRVEELLELPDTSTILGAGDLATDGFPLLDGSAALIGAWGTYGTSSYTKTVTTEAVGCLYVTDANGVPLKFVSSQAAVDAEVGTFTSNAGSDSETPAGTYTVTVNVGGDPTGAGYRHSARALVSCTNLTMRFLRLRGSASRNGIDAAGVGDVRYCVFENTSPVHFMVMSGGTYEDNFCRYQFKGFWTSEGSPATGPLLEGYVSDASDFDIAWRRNVIDCTGADVGSATINGIGGHADVRYNRVDTEDNYLIGCKLDVGSMRNLLGDSLRDRVEGGYIQWGGTGGSLIDPWVHDADGTFSLIGLSNSGATVEGARLFGDASNGSISGIAGATIRKSAITCDGAASNINQTGLGITNTDIPAEVTDVIFDSTTFFNEFYRMGGGGLVDRNAYIGGFKVWRVDGVQRTDFAAHKAATGLDANSVFSYTAARLTDPANGDYTIANAAGLPPTAGLERFPTYTTAPANADAAEAVLLALAA